MGIYIQQFYIVYEIINNKIEKWKWGMCQRDNNPTKEQATAEGHQWVFNAAIETPTPGGAIH